MKNPKFKEFDMSKPIELNNATDLNDCFGNEWEPTHTDCTLCHANAICGTLFHERTKAIKPDKPLLDKTEFDDVPWDAFKEKINEVSFEQLVEAVQHYSRCPDRQTVIDYCKNWMKTL